MDLICAICCSCDQKRNQDPEICHVVPRGAHWTSGLMEGTLKMSIIETKLERLKVACWQYLFFKPRVAVFEDQCEQYVMYEQVYSSQTAVITTEII